MKLKFILLSLFIPLGIYGQKSDYYLTDSATVVGVKLIDAGDKKNSQFISAKKGQDVVQLSPDEVREYGFADKRVYLSKKIHIDDTVRYVFLEKLIEGKVFLYYYRGKTKLFFVERNGSLLEEIPKNKGNEKSTYKAHLKKITEDCPEVANAANFVGYNKQSFMRFIDRYKECELKPFPHFRYGIKAGYEWSKIIISKGSTNQALEQFDYRYEGAFAIGLFMDLPINMSDFSLNIGINYSRQGYSYNKLYNGKDNDFVANLSSLKMPVLVRYSFPSNTCRFFMQSGGIVEYNFNKDINLYESTSKGNVITIESHQAVTKIDDYQLGFSLGAGIEYRVTTRNSLFFELSFNQLYGSIRNRNILLTIGLNI